MVRAKALIQALFFDAYGTLLDLGPLTQICEELAPGRGQLMSELWRRKQLEYSWILSLMGRYESFDQITMQALRFALQAHQLRLHQAQVTKAARAYLELKTFPEVEQALRGLSELPLGILSNGAPEMLRSVLKCNGLDKTFQTVVSVEAVGIYKPSPSVYELVLKFFKGSLNASQIGFVTANAWDAAGAKNFGFQVIRVNRQGLPPEPIAGLEADFEIRGLDQLGPIVRR